MAAYCYLKKKQKKEVPLLRFLPVVMLVVGLILLGNVFLPIFLYQLKSKEFNKPLLTPLAEAFNEPADWFVNPPSFVPFDSKITHYTLTISKLGINKAVVMIGSGDLSKSLVQYPGTALPGQKGNTVIYGHSVLPQFFNSKNYKTIFSTLPTLKEGDDLLLDFDGITYKYKVIKLFEVTPKDTSVLEQHFDGEYLSLITCAPPGTYLRRLIVRARLVEY